MELYSIYANITGRNVRLNAISCNGQLSPLVLAIGIIIGAAVVQTAGSFLLSSESQIATTQDKT